MFDQIRIDPQWVAVIVSLISLGLTLALGLRVFLMTQVNQPTYACDSQFLEIQKILLSTKELYSFYSLDPAMAKLWSGYSEDEKRMYIFCEMYYFHLAFVHREYVEKRVSKDYWQLVESFVKRLKRYSPMFMQVHSNERTHFESEFARIVDSL